jgi:predicted permease
MNDFRYALRALGNNLGFTVVTTALLALGIGANCVIFSALDAVLLRPLAVRQPGQLYRVIQNLPQLGKRSYQPYAVYSALRQRSTVASDVFGEEDADVALTEPGPATQIRVHLVTDNYFTALGVGALYGRVLAPDDAQSAVLSYGFWRRVFAGDPRAVGRSIVLGGHRFTVVGVLPGAFNGFSIDTAPDVRVPLKVHPLIASNGKPTEAEAYFDLAIRLRPGVSVSQAAGETNSIWRAAWEGTKNSEPWQLSKGIELEPLEHGTSRLRERFSGALMFLVAAVGVLLLMVCANVAGLLLARSAARRQEISVRLALGATRTRLVRQMLTESFLLTGIGGLGGIALAYLASPLLARALPPVRDYSSVNLPLALNIQPDLRVLAFSVLLCVLTAVLFGLAPAVAASNADYHSALRSARSSGGWRGRQALVLIEVALCTLLLAGAGLLVRTFEHLDRLDAGFDRDHIITFNADPRLNHYTPQQDIALRNALLDRVRALPGVRSVAFATIGLMRGTGMKMTIAPAGQKTSKEDFLNSSSNGVSPEYFDTMGLRLLAGRIFREDERTSPPRKPMVVNQTFAHRFFPGQDPIGKTFGLGMNVVVKDDFEIIGVVTDAKYRSLREPIQPTSYGLYALDPNSAMPLTLHIRTSERPESIIGAVRGIFREIDPALPIVEIRTLAAEVDASLWSERLVAVLASIFGLLASLLAAVGLYGLLAYAVAQRTREIGIRVALGASPSEIFRWAGQEALILTVAGVAIGLAATFALAPAVRSLLYGVASNDTGTMIGSVVVVIAIASLAAVIPIARALRVDPAIALRQE